MKDDVAQPLVVLVIGNKENRKLQLQTRKKHKTIKRFQGVLLADHSNVTVYGRCSLARDQDLPKGDEFVRVVAISLVGMRPRCRKSVSWRKHAPALQCMLYK